MDRNNPGGIPRADLAYYLTRVDHVRTAVETDSCLLCRSPKVNEAGLCSVCTPQLSNAELDLVEKWMNGQLH